MMKICWLKHVSESVVTIEVSQNMIREQEFQSKGTVSNDIMKLFVGVGITILGF